MPKRRAAAAASDSSHGGVNGSGGGGGGGTGTGNGGGGGDGGGGGNGRCSGGGGSSGGSGGSSGRGAKKNSSRNQPQPRAAGISALLAASLAFAASLCLTLHYRYGLGSTLLTPAPARTRARAPEELTVGEVDHRECSKKDYRRVARGCTPRGSACGRLVLDGFASDEEVEGLRSIAMRGMAMGGGAGGPTILDLQSGALSYGDKFVDVWLVLNVTDTPAYTRSELSVYHKVVQRAAEQLQMHFGAQPTWLTAPTFFSRISADKPPKIPNDEYWHTHVDTLQYGTFVFTGLLYLVTAGEDFEGGRLVFEDGEGGAEAVVSPKKGRLVLFTSGHEFPHRVEKVTNGTRLALTIAFTCHEEGAIQDFLGRALPD